MTLYWLDPSMRQQAFIFYKRYMPHARLRKKERLAVKYFNNNPQEPLIAAVRLRSIGPYQLLTGMLVHPDHRNQGVAHHLMRALSPELNTCASFLFALPELVPFYRQHQFSSEGVFPVEIAQLHQRYLNQGKSLTPMHFNNQPDAQLTK